MDQFISKSTATVCAEEGDKLLDLEFAFTEGPKLCLINTRSIFDGSIEERDNSFGKNINKNDWKNSATAFKISDNITL